MSGFRRDNKYCDVKEEQSSLFNGKRSLSVSQSCTHKFVCLSSTNADRVPTSKLGRLVLEQAGLGEKSITVPNINCHQEHFRCLILTAFPKLKGGGGFELLRCKPHSRDLVLIGHRITNCPKLWKRQVVNGKVYVRPIQRDLNLDVVSSEEDTELVGQFILSDNDGLCSLHYFDIVGRGVSACIVGRK